MKNKVFFVIVILGLILAACAPTASSSGSNQPGAANVGNGGALPVATEVADEWPNDVPLPPEAFDIDVARSGTQLNFKVPGDIDAIMAYFQAELPGHGWETEVTPDSAVGAIASMLRTNAEGHRMAINIQYNQLGDFVTISMALTREGN